MKMTKADTNSNKVHKNIFFLNARKIINYK